MYNVNFDSNNYKFNYIYKIVKNIIFEINITNLIIKHNFITFLKLEKMLNFYGIISKFKNIENNLIQFFGLNSLINCSFYQECNFILKEKFIEIIMINFLHYDINIKFCFSSCSKLYNCDLIKYYIIKKNNITTQTIDYINNNVYF